MSYHGAVRALLALWVIVGSSSMARAQSAADDWAPPDAGSRPTSGEASFLSGRTLGGGETFMAAALGWPGIWAHVELAPLALFNIGIRGSVLYGAPAFGLVAGAGGELALPMRIHLLGEGEIDIALRLAPEVALGEGRLFGEQSSVIYAGDLGVSSRLDGGLRIGWRLAERVTLLAGADLGVGISWVEGDRAHAIGVFTGVVGIEALMSRDTMLFAELVGGGGIAEAGSRAVPYYPDPAIFRLSLGLGYLL